MHVPDPSWKQLGDNPIDPDEDQLDQIILDLLVEMDRYELESEPLIFAAAQAALRDRALDVWFDKLSEPIEPDLFGEDNWD
jgi:hypothetical protein